MEHAKALESILFNYDFVGAKVYVSEQLEEYSNDYIGSEGIYLGDNIITSPSAPFDNSYVFSCIENTEFDKDVLLITELYDNKNGSYLYTVLNTVDSSHKNNPSAMNIEQRFDKKFSSIKVFDSGKWLEKKLIISY